MLEELVVTSNRVLGLCGAARLHKVRLAILLPSALFLLVFAAHQEDLVGTLLLLVVVVLHVVELINFRLLLEKECWLLMWFLWATWLFVAFVEFVFVETKLVRGYLAVWMGLLFLTGAFVASVFFMVFWLQVFKKFYSRVL